MSNVKQQLFQLNKMSKRSVARYHKFAIAAGISDSALGILYALLQADSPCSQNDLCNEWALPKQTINTTVGALQKKGFVTLSQVACARNKKDVALTAAGKAFAEKTVKVLFDAESGALLSLTPDERSEYVRLNQKYNQALTEALDAILKNSVQH